MRGFGYAIMNNENLKQIRESITNTVSCIDAHNGTNMTNKILNDHLKALTDMEAALLGMIHICDYDPSLPKPSPPASVTLTG